MARQTSVDDKSKQSGKRMLTHAGRTQGATAWARELGLSFRGLQSRLRRGMPVAKALSYRKASSRSLKRERGYYANTN